MAVLGILVTALSSARALTFNITYDSSTVGAPSGFFSAFQDAINFYQDHYSDPITVNIQVGWGQIGGQNLTPGILGESWINNQEYYNYSQVVSALAGDATSPADATAIANLPATYPVANAQFAIADAEAKALGLLAGNTAGLDGYVGFDNSVAYTFDPNNRSVLGKYDFIGLAAHEITEVMGRFGMLQTGPNSILYSPIDLFRYLSPGTLNTLPANGAYFSINGGVTSINTFNGTGGGDLTDWAGATRDPYNHDLTKSFEESESAGDVTLMDVLGYDLTAVPEPSVAALLAVGIIGWIYRRYAEKNRQRLSVRPSAVR